MIITINITQREESNDILITSNEVKKSRINLNDAINDVDGWNDRIFLSGYKKFLLLILNQKRGLN
ncbi:hypothetical protein BpHYR1_014390 [Brachionus plicatilis]|uniref:Uncharacterized protein n=1 Tax=Brachionus plicatilis TaxID=10195 RepID=A0A3M7RLP9_BRAPC|nr:hypothetical protein BpHYR1_014390 [Brachionus plicatilis]